MAHSYKYDVALSYAESEKKYAEELATELKKLKIIVYYDEFEKSSSWGKNMADYRDQVFRKQSRFTIIFISANYEEECRLQRRSAQSKNLHRSAYDEDQEYILPIRFDGLVGHVANF